MTAVGVKGLATSIINSEISDGRLPDMFVWQYQHVDHR